MRPRAIFLIHYLCLGIALEISISIMTTEDGTPILHSGKGVPHRQAPSSPTMTNPKVPALRRPLATVAPGRASVRGDLAQVSRTSCAPQRSASSSGGPNASGPFRARVDAFSAAHRSGGESHFL